MTRGKYANICAALSVLVATNCHPSESSNKMLIAEYPDKSSELVTPPSAGKIRKGRLLGSATVVAADAESVTLSRGTVDVG